MDAQSNIYSEKKLAYFETTYKENILAKPQDVNLSITAAHLFGLAFICDQVGTKEEDPTYTRFSCGYEEITKIYINNNNKNSPIYIQCDEASKGVMNRRRIILPCFPNNDEIVNIITSAKAEFDKKTEKQRENEKNNKLKNIEEEKLKERERLKKASDEEFERITADYASNKSNASNTSANDFSVADMLGLDEISVPEAEPEAVMESTPLAADFDEIELPESIELPPPEEVESSGMKQDKEFESIPEDMYTAAKISKTAAEPKPAPAPAPAPKAEPKPAPAPAPAPKAEPKPAPAPAPAPKAEPKPAPAPAPAPKAEPKPAPAPAPAPKAEPKPAPAPKAEKAVDVSDITGGKETMTLEEFQTAVMKLKSMLDNQLISDAEFAEEKKKLMNFLY
ncbi:MAG: hypothetical protein ACI4JF_11255 [Oscillospiraceae bacterium]